MTRRLAAIMFTDVVGYTSSAQDDESRALALLQEQEQLVRPLISKHGGRTIKSTGDGLLAEFESALHAVEGATDILRALEDRNASASGPAIQLRIGIHLGDVEGREGDIFGDAVNIASRIQPLALPGGLCISGPVFDQVRNKLPYRFEKLPPTPLKHVRVPIDVYRVAAEVPATEGPPAAPPRTRVAVLPLANISPDPKDEYFADGLTEELIGALSKLRDLRVIARTSVAQYKGTTKPVAQIGSELGVGTVLEGSVRKAGNRLRVSLQLIDAGSQEHVWADQFDRQMDDVFTLQSEIAERTASALHVELVGAERSRIQKRPTSSLAAYELYLRGLHAFREFSGMTRPTEDDPIPLFEAAIREDPQFSQAYSALANAQIGFAGVTLDPAVAFPRAKELVARALELDPDSSDAHTARGNLALQHELDWALAEREFQKAIALNPSDSSAYFWYTLLLALQQRYDEGVRMATTAIALDPLWDLPRGSLAQIRFLQGDLEESIRMTEELIARNPGQVTNRAALATMYLLTGRLEEARQQVALASQGEGRANEIVSAMLEAWLGHPEKARALAASRSPTPDYVNPTLWAQLLASIGERERALDLLEEDVRNGGTTFAFSYRAIGFDSLSEDPRFRALIAKFHLPPGRPSLRRLPSQPARGTGPPADGK
jgi:adenylate cyclase